MPEDIKLSVTSCAISTRAQITSGKAISKQTYSAAVIQHEAEKETPIALFVSESEARDYRQWKAQTAEQRLDAALCVVRQDYYQDVRDTAESIKAELLDRIKEQECGDSLREWLQEHIHETIDGSSRVIYTQSAMLGMFASDNDGAYFDQFGDEGAVEDGSVNWSRLCFSAFETDVIEQLGSIGVDVNEPLPACEDCGEDDQDTERYIVGDTDDVLCESCKEAREADSADDQEDDQDDAEDVLARASRQADERGTAVLIRASAYLEDGSLSNPGESTADFDQEAGS